MKPPKFTHDQMIQEREKYMSSEELKLYDMGWRKTYNDHWTDGKTGRQELDHMPIKDEPQRIYFSIPSTDEELKQRQMKGGLKYKENEEKRRTLQDRTRTILRTRLKDSMISELLGVPEEDLELLGLHDADFGTVMTFGQTMTGTKGSAKCAEFIRDTAGEKPVNTQEISVFTDADKELCRKLAARMGINDEEP